MHQPEWRKGSAKVSESISLATFWGRSSGNRYLLYRLFFTYLSNLFIGCCRPFYSFTIHRSTDFCWFEFDCSRDLRIIIRVSNHWIPHMTLPYHPRLFSLSASLASLLSLLSPVHSYGGCARPHLSWLTGNE